MPQFLKRPVWILTLLSFLIILVRIRYLHEPFDNDITIRMAYAIRSLSGDAYYSNLFVFGPPGALWVNEFFIRAFGLSELTVYIIGCTFAILTLFGIYRLATLLGGQTAGLIAALVWTAVSADILSEANQPNSEVYVNAAISWGFAFALDPRNATTKYRLFLAGLLFFFASTVKHHLLFIPVSAALMTILFSFTYSPNRHPRPLYSALRDWSYILLVAVIGWALLIGWYFVTGRLTPFVNGLFAQSIAYAGRQGMIGNLITGLTPYFIIPPVQRGFIPLYLLLVLSCAIGIFRTKDSRWYSLLGWAIGTWMCVSITGRFYPHYYTLWYPLLSIGSGFALAYLASNVRASRRRAAQFAVVVAVFLLYAVQAIQIVRYNAQEAVFAKYGERYGSIFTETREVGLLLSKADAEKTLFELGAYGIYFYANRLPPKPYVDSLYGAPKDQFGDAYKEAMLPVLLRARPDVVVVRREFMDERSSDPRAQMWRALLQQEVYTEQTDIVRPRLAIMVRVDKSSH